MLEFIKESASSVVGILVTAVKGSGTGAVSAGTAVGGFVSRQANQNKLIRRLLVVWSAGLITATFLLIRQVVLQVVGKIDLVDANAANIVSTMVSLMTITSGVLTMLIGQYNSGRIKEDVAAATTVSVSTDTTVDTTVVSAPPCNGKSPTYNNQ